MKSPHLAFSLLWIVFAALAAFQSVRLNIGNLNSPGPGFLPFCSSVAIGILSFALLVSQVRKTKKEQGNLGGFKLGRLWMKTVFFLSAAFIYMIIIWEKIGYLIGTPFLLFFLLKFVGSQSVKRSIIISMISTIISYLIFQTWLYCMLPKGLLKDFNF